MRKPSVFAEVYSRSSNSAYYPNPSKWLMELVGSRDVQKWRAADIGCGDGRNTIFLSKMGVSTLAVDVSAVAVSKASRLLRDGTPELARSTFWLCADATKLSFPDEQFDLIVCATLLDNLSERSAKSLVGSLISALAPQGWLYLTAFTTKDPKSGNATKGLEGSETLSPQRFFVVPGDLRRWVAPLRVEKYSEGLEEDTSHGPSHFHGIERVLAFKS